MFVYNNSSHFVLPVCVIYDLPRPAEQEPGTEFIDLSVIDGGLNYILGKQSNDGDFPVTGPVHNFELLVSMGLRIP